ncbi:MAG TPA: GNAT family N-acetyltransferase [Herpetosiphonaceae bacterium]
MFLEIETERLRLRLPRTADAEATVAVNNHRAVFDMTVGMPFPFTLADAHEWIAQALAEAERGTTLDFVIELKATGEIVGICGLDSISREHDSAEVHYRLNPAFWGRGIATETLRRVLQFAFEDLQLERVLGRCIRGNDASAQVLQKCGLRYEGCTVHDCKKNGVYHDLLWFGIIRAWWQAE